MERNFVDKWFITKDDSNNKKICCQGNSVGPRPLPRIS